MSIFDKKPYKSVESYPYKFDFYLDEKKVAKNDDEGSYLQIYSIGEEHWEMKISVKAHAYGYLLAALEQGAIKQLHDYARLMWSASMLATTEQGVNNDLWRAILKWQKRQQKQAERRAKAGTEHEELASQSLMTDVAAYADATPKERKQMRKQWKEDAREALKEDEV